MENYSIVEKNNKGFSLVELIIAISIGTIVAGVVAALLSFSIKMYTKQSMNTAIQRELQMTVNQIVDSAQSASWFYINNSGGNKTQVLALGSIKDCEVTLEGGGTTTKKCFVGELFVAGDDDGSVSGRFNIYMDRYAEGVLEVADESDALTKLQGKVSDIEDAISGATKGKEYLLGEDAKKFYIDISKNKDGDYINFNTTSKEYQNPISLNLDVIYERSGYGAENVTGEIKDQVMLRNRLKSKVYYGTNPYTMKE